MPRPAQRAPPPPNRAAAIAAADGGVADAHFAQANQIAVRRHGVVAGRDRGEEFALAERRAFGEVGGRLVERQRNDAERRAGGAGELVDGGAACGEIRHHLHGDLGGIGGDALPGDAVIAGKDQHSRAIEPRRRVALPVREPGDEILEPAEAPRRLGQRILALGDGGAGGRMAARQIEADGAQVGEGGEVRHG